MADMLLELVKSRHSTRSFTGESINEETIQKILNIAMYAPSSWGGHPIEFIVIRDKNTLKKLARCKAMGAGPLAYSDVAIVVLTDKRNLELWVEDAAVASTYILLACEYYGIGACWIHMKDRKGHTKMAEDDIRELLHIPQYYGILNVVSLGVKKDNTRNKETRIDTSKIHYESYL